MPAVDKLLIILCSLFVGLCIVLLQTYEHFKPIAETLVTVSGIAGFVLAIIEFIRKKD